MLHKNDPNITNLNISRDHTYHADLFYQIIRFLDKILDTETLSELEQKGQFEQENQLSPVHL